MYPELWVDEDTELSPEDLIRVYLGYTLPADAINATNDIARYRLPDTLHLTDEQMSVVYDVMRHYQGNADAKEDIMRMPQGIKKLLLQVQNNIEHEMA